MQFPKIRIYLFILTYIFPFILLQCSKSDPETATLIGRIFVVYDSAACECIREQGESIIHQLDSLRAVNASLDHYFTFQWIDWANEQEAANAIRDRCNDPLIPVVLIENPQEQAVFNFSFEFDPIFFHQILKNLKEMKSGY